VKVDNTSTTHSTTMIIHTTTPIYERRIQQQAFVVQQKMRILIAFVATMLFLCIENVKAFTQPLSNPDTLLIMASGAHSMAKRYRAKPTAFNTRPTPQSRPAEEKNQPTNCGIQSQLPSRSQRSSSTSLRMAFSFGMVPPKDAAPTLDMKTSINAFGSWYNKMDPVARPPEYDDDETDYSLSSPADSWPSSFEEESTTSTAAYLTSPRSTSTSSFGNRRRPRPIKTIRKIAGWVFRSTPTQYSKGFGSQSFL